MQVIGDKFKAMTVLTVAHRIHTIIESDTLLCFDAGRLKQKGSPHALLQDSNSVFYGLVEETGEASSQLLRARAAEKCAPTTATSRTCPASGPRRRLPDAHRFQGHGSPPPGQGKKA